MKNVRIASLIALSAALLVSALTVSACSNGESAAAASAPAAASSSAAASAAPAAPTPASAPAVTPAPSASTPEAAPAPPVAASAVPAPAAPAPAAPPTAAEREAARKAEQIAWALKQDEIKNDPGGQWATAAKASSTFNDARGNAPYSASQATGEPNVQVYSTTSQAWSSKTADSGIEWLELTFAKAVHATAVRVRESAGSGALIKIEVFDDKGMAQSVWSGSDSTKDLNYLIAEFPKTAFKTNRVKLTLATNIVAGWNQIDAVQLVGTGQ
jgi:hypothetical protein